MTQRRTGAARRAALLAPLLLLLLAPGRSACAANDGSRQAWLTDPEHGATRRLNALHAEALALGGDDYDEDDQDFGPDGASYGGAVVNIGPLGTEDVDPELEELTPRSAALPPLDHSKQRYWACLHPDSPPVGTGGPQPACRFPRRTAVQVRQGAQHNARPSTVTR